MKQSVARSNFNDKQRAKMYDLLCEELPKTRLEKDLWNLRFMRHSILFGSFEYRSGMIATLDRAIKKLEKEIKNESSRR